MSRENVETGTPTRRLFERVAEAFNARDHERLTELSHPSAFEFTSHFVSVGGKPYTDWRAYFRDIDASWEDFRIQPAEVIPNTSETAAIVAWRCWGRGIQSGVPVDQVVHHAWEIRDGRLARGRSCATLSEALRAIGLPEQRALSHPDAR